MSVFTPASNDLSIKLLGRLFGQGWSHAFLSHSAAGAPGVLASLFQTFNIIVLSGITLFFMYVMTTGVIGSAYEGNVGGKRLHNFWVPVRGIAGVSLVTPIGFAKGYCLMQLLIFLFLGYGIGAADHLWNQVVYYYSHTPGQIQATTDAAVYGPRDARKILRMLVVRDFLIEKQNLRALKPARWTSRIIYSGDGASSPSTTSNSGFVGDIKSAYAKFSGVMSSATGVGQKQPTHIEYIMNFSQLSGMQPGMLGDISFRCPVGVKKISICEKRRVALTRMYNALTPVAARIVNDKYVTAAPIKAAIKAYTNAVTTIDREWVSTINSRLQTWLTQWAVQSRSEGWITAGEWASQLGGDSTRLAALDAAHAQIAGWDKSELASILLGANGGLDGYLGNADDLLAQISARGEFSDAMALAAQRPAPKARTRGQLWERSISEKLTSIVTGLTASVAASPTPILAMVAWGHKLLTLAQSMAAGGVAGGFVGLSGGPIYWAVIAAAASAGFVLAVVLPNLMFLLFTMAVLSFFVVAVEVVVAAALWAAAHVFPEGEGWAGTHGREGYMLFLTVLMQPSLMIFGLFLAGAMFDIIALLFGQGFDITLAQHSATLGLFAAVGYLFLACVMFWLLARHAFGLISLLPKQVPRYIGQLAQQLGDDTPDRATKVVGGAFGRGVGSVERGLGGGGGGGRPAPSAAAEYDPAQLGRNMNPLQDAEDATTGGDSARGPNSTPGAERGTGPNSVAEMYSEYAQMQGDEPGDSA